MDAVYAAAADFVSMAMCDAAVLVQYSDNYYFCSKAPPWPI